MPPDSLCGTFLTNKRSLVAFTWTITTVLTLIAFVLAIAMILNVHGHYVRMDRYYNALMDYDDWYQKCDNGGDDDDDDQKHNDDDNNSSSNDNSSCEQYDDEAANREIQLHLQLGQMGSKSVVAVAVYTVLMALGLSLYGSTTLIGFTSINGHYIAPCFSPTAHQGLKIGMFGGAIVLFANVLFVCAMVLSEVRVSPLLVSLCTRRLLLLLFVFLVTSKHTHITNVVFLLQKIQVVDGIDRRDRQNMEFPMEPYEVVRISTILAVTCMLLAPLYIIFAVLLFFFYGDMVVTDDDEAMNSALAADFYALDTTARGQGTTFIPPVPSPQPNIISSVSQTPGTIIQQPQSQQQQQPPPPPPPIINHTGFVGTGSSTRSLSRRGSGEPRIGVPVVPQSYF